MTLPIAQVVTSPYCGACGYDVAVKSAAAADQGRDTNTDLICDSCGAPLGAFNLAQVTGVNKVAAPNPSNFTPLGNVGPWDLAGLTALGALGETTAWTAGQFVYLGDGSQAHWDGAAWAAGVTPGS